MEDRKYKHRAVAKGRFVLEERLPLWCQTEEGWGEISASWNPEHWGAQFPQERQGTKAGTTFLLWGKKKESSNLSLTTKPKGGEARTYLRKKGNYRLIP